MNFHCTFNYYERYISLHITITKKEKSILKLLINRKKKINFNIIRILFERVTTHFNSFQHDEKRKSAIIKELNRLQAAILRTTKRIVELENERKILQIEIQSEHKKVDLFNALFAKENKLLAEKKEALYQVDFNLQKCEMKLERVRGHEHDKSEVERKQTRIEELQAALKEKTATSKLLQNQIVSLEVKTHNILHFFYSV